MKESNGKVDVLEQGKTTTIPAEEGGYQVSLTPKKMIVGLFLTTLLLIVGNVCTSIALVKVSSQANLLEVNEDGQLVLRGTDTIVATREAAIPPPIPTLEVVSKFLPSSTTHHDSHERGLNEQYLVGSNYAGDSVELGYPFQDKTGGWKQVKPGLASVTKTSAEEVFYQWIPGKEVDIKVNIGGCEIPATIQPSVGLEGKNWDGGFFCRRYHHEHLFFRKKKNISWTVRDHLSGRG